MSPFSPLSSRAEARSLPLSLSLKRKATGFTLMEVLLGLALFSILIGGVFSVQRGTLETSRAITEREAKT
ncbi:MAG: prepilin-type N-terminal cleavage/methylation domain-containing protein, partial [Verrucomicrobiaceae bacterium]